MLLEDEFRAQALGEVQGFGGMEAMA